MINIELVNELRMLPHTDHSSGLATQDPKVVKTIEYIIMCLSREEIASQLMFLARQFPGEFLEGLDVTQM